MKKPSGLHAYCQYWGGTYSNEALEYVVSSISLMNFSNANSQIGNTETKYEMIIY